jgi:hypothetical protein
MILSPMSSLVIVDLLTGPFLTMVIKTPDHSYI